MVYNMDPYPPTQASRPTRKIGTASSWLLSKVHSPLVTVDYNVFGMGFVFRSNRAYDCFRRVSTLQHQLVDRSLGPSELRSPSFRRFELLDDRPVALEQTSHRIGQMRSRLVWEQPRSSGIIRSTFEN
ncbi:hypothetical protein PM082_017955 [Marasmius tenuissimus]|nr:hypothetical protein PM082_017955 [Marasmius tenuissimus]